MEKNNRFVSNMMLLLIFLALAMMIYIVVIAKSEGGQCQLSPLTYGAEKASEINYAAFSCTCSLNKPNSPIIGFDRHEVKTTYITPDIPELPPNFSFTMLE